MTERATRVDGADAGRAQVHPVGGAALDDLRVAADDLDAGGAGGVRDRLDLAPQHVRVEALFEDHRDGQGQRLGARHREVVDGAVDRQLTDRSAGEAERLDDEAVGGHRHPGVA